MSLNALRAAAQLELNRRRAAAVLIQQGECWRCRGQLLTAGEAAAFRKTHRGQIVGPAKA